MERTEPIERTARWIAGAAATLCLVLWAQFVWRLVDQFGRLEGLGWFAAGMVALWAGALVTLALGTLRWALLVLLFALFPIGIYFMGVELANLAAIGWSTLVYLAAAATAWGLARRREGAGRPRPA